MNQAPDKGSVHLNEAENWESIRLVMRQQIGESDYRSWLQPLYLASSQADRVVLAAPSRFVRDWVQANYLGLLLEGWRALNSKILLVELIVRAPQQKKIGTSDKLRLPSALSRSANEPARTGPEVHLDRLTSPLDPNYTLDSFIVAAPNELAVAAVKRVVGNTKPSFNPLVIYGGVGLGKTHLLQALAWSVRAQDPTRRVGYISAEKFLYSFVRSIKDRTTENFKQQIRDFDLLLIDDMQYISSGGATQEEFVQTFNSFFDRNRQVVVATNRPPARLEQLDERLRSRLLGGLAVDLRPTTEGLRLSVLRKKVAPAQHLIPDSVLSFVAEKIATNIRELEGALNRLVAHATLINKPIDLAFAKSVLQDLLTTSQRQITIDDIQQQVAAHYDLEMKDLLSSRRSRQIARPRQLAMYLSKELTSRSLPQIGHRFGGRDHTTVLHAIRKIDELIVQDQGLAEDLERIRINLRSH